MNDMLFIVLLVLSLMLVLFAFDLPPASWFIDWWIRHTVPQDNPDAGQDDENQAF